MKLSKNKLGLAMLNAGVDSIRDLAAVSGVSINTISRSNNGGSVKLPTLRRIAGALKVDPAELLEEV
ncbi:helix-turn-helix transcriptional regulator [Oscillospiraceae bacterium 44-5]